MSEEIKEILPSSVVWHFAIGIDAEGNVYTSEEESDLLVSRLTANDPKEFNPEKVSSLTKNLRMLIGVNPKRKGKGGRPPKNKTKENAESAQSSVQKTEKANNKPASKEQPTPKTTQPLTSVGTSKRILRQTNPDKSVDESTST